MSMEIKRGGSLHFNLNNSQLSKRSQELTQVLPRYLAAPRVINDQFKQYYSTLYQSEVDSSSSESHLFLDSIDIPKLSPDAQSLLEQPLLLEEIANAIRSCWRGRAPGPDGFPMEFYKELWP